MNKNEAIGVLKTIIDFNYSDYIKEALEMSIKSLQALESAHATSKQSVAIAKIAERLEQRVRTDRQMSNEEAWQDIVTEAVRQLRQVLK